MMDFLQKKKSDDLPSLPTLEGNEEEEVKERKRIKILTPNKLLTRCPVLLAKIKAGNNSYKLKNRIIQIPHLLYQILKYNKLLARHIP